MLLTNKRMSKMSEVCIADQYSRYLQKVLIIETEIAQVTVINLNQQQFLNYEEFKDYYILTLVGKHDYIAKLAHKIQQQNILDGA